jgi:hypothetical protein
VTKKERVDFSRPVSVSFVVVVRQLQVLPERVLREQRVQLQQRPVRVRARLGRSRYARDILSLSLSLSMSLCLRVSIENCATFGRFTCTGCDIECPLTSCEDRGIGVLCTQVRSLDFSIVIECRRFVLLAHDFTDFGSRADARPAAALQVRQGLVRLQLPARGALCRSVGCRFLLSFTLVF